MCLHRFTQTWLNQQTKFMSESETAQNTNRIFDEPRVRIADHTQDTRLNIGDTVYVIDELIVDRIVEKSIDCEVASFGIFFRRAENIVAWRNSVWKIFGLHFAAKCGDFK